MAQLTTGIIENTPDSSGVRPSTSLVVRITNDDTVSNALQISGFYLSGAIKTEYVSELLALAPESVIVRYYFTQFSAFEFQFATSSNAVEVSAWGKDAAGNLVITHRVVPEELSQFG